MPKQQRVGSTRVYVAENATGEVVVVGSRELNYFFSGIPDSLCVQAALRKAIVEHGGSAAEKKEALLTLGLGSPMQMAQSGSFSLKQVQDNAG